MLLAEMRRLDSKIDDTRDELLAEIRRSNVLLLDEIRRGNAQLLAALIGHTHNEITGAAEFGEVPAVADD